MKDTNRKYLLIALSIFFIAFAIRLIHFFVIRNNPVFLNPILDARQYDEWAREIIEKDWLSRSFDFMSPAYSYFLAFIYLLFGVSIKSVAIIQFLIGSVNCVLVFFLVKRIFVIQNISQKIILSQANIDLIGIIAALLSAFYGLSVFYESLLLKVVLINFCNLMLLLFLLIGIDKQQIKYYFFAGLFFGFSYFLRPNILLFLPFILVWLFFIKSLNLKKKLIYVFILFAGIFTFSTPFWIRNYSINHEFVLASGHGGINFYLGNNPTAKGIYEAQYFFAPDTKNEHEDFAREACRLTGKKLSTMEVSDYWYEQSFNFIFTETGQWTKLLIRKFFIFWNAYEIPVNGLEYQLSKDYFPVLKILILNFAILAPLALLGMILLFNKNNRINLLLIYVFVNILGAVIFFNCSEYRVPVLIAFFVFASYAIFWIYKMFREKKYNTISLSFLVLIPCLFLVKNNKFKVEDDGLKGSLYNSLGTIYAKNKDYNQAIRYYKDATFVSPDSPEININLANAYVKKGMFEYAIVEYNNTLTKFKQIVSKDNSINIDSVAVTGSMPLKRAIFDVHLRLGEAYIMVGQFENARDQFIASLEIDSLSKFALCDLGIVYANLHEFDKAEFWLKKSLEIDPNLEIAKNAINWINQQK